MFPDVDWLIGNHSDELTPWIPVMAARQVNYLHKIIKLKRAVSGTAVKFILLPSYNAYFFAKELDVSEVFTCK